MPSRSGSRLGKILHGMEKLSEKIQNGITRSSLKEAENQATNRSTAETFYGNHEFLSFLRRGVEGTLEPFSRFGLALGILRARVVSSRSSSSTRPGNTLYSLVQYSTVSHHHHPTGTKSSAFEGRCNIAEQVYTVQQIFPTAGFKIVTDPYTVHSPLDLA